ncbi:MAG TPA: aldehyde dehydrogenase family protein, partial [Gammaproteobacteria bacterium]|nr:aldehyde dehydrogenase family protein [Gammaproteobacteria bacterium]
MPVVVFQEPIIMSHHDPAAILAALGLAADNDGVWTIDGRSGGGAVLESVNPSTGQPIAKVRAASEADYERVVASAQAAAHAWREVPAPKRGEAVRLLAQALRDNKDALGSL